MVKCQVCAVPIREDRVYFRKYRICREHASPEPRLVRGQLVQWCQQCGNFHPVVGVPARMAEPGLGTRAAPRYAYPKPLMHRPALPSNSQDEFNPDRKSCRRSLQRSREAAAAVRRDAAAARVQDTRPSVSRTFPTHTDSLIGMGHETRAIFPPESGEKLSTLSGSSSSGIPTLEDLLASNLDVFRELAGGAELEGRAPVGAPASWAPHLEPGRAAPPVASPEVHNGYGLHTAQPSQQQPADADDGTLTISSDPRCDITLDADQFLSASHALPSAAERTNARLYKTHSSRPRYFSLPAATSPMPDCYA